MELIFADDSNLFLSHKNIDTLIETLKHWNIDMNMQMSQGDLSQTNCPWILIKLNCSYFILSQKGSYYHRLCLTLLKIYISKGSI